MRHCSFLLYDSEAMVWRKRERFIRIMAAQMDNLRGISGTTTMESVPSA